MEALRATMNPPTLTCALSAIFPGAEALKFYVLLYLAQARRLLPRSLWHCASPIKTPKFALT